MYIKRNNNLINFVNLSSNWLKYNIYYFQNVSLNNTQVFFCIKYFNTWVLYLSFEI